MYVFTEISLVIFTAAVLSLILYLLKQPLIIAYILAGIVVGPIGLNLIQSQETLQIFSQLGITILLFIIGLHLNPTVIKEVGGVSLITGLGQIIFTSLIGFGLTKLFGFSNLEAIFIALALTFSSTIIILKLLNDKSDLDKLYGKISVGFLLVQDLAACLILLVVSLLAQSGQLYLTSTLIILSLRVIALSLVVVGLSYYLLPRLLHLIAQSQELLFLFSVTWGLIIATAFSSTGLSIEVGALIAGITLSSTVFATEMASKLRPLRDFFIVTFFILLGSHIVLQSFTSMLLPAIVLSLFVLVGNPLIVFYLMNLMGFQNRTGFMAGLTVAQISEFSMILVTLGYQTQQVSREVVSLVTFVGIITIALSSYMIIYSNRLYALLAPVLRFISIRKIARAEIPPPTTTYHAILFGHGRVGSDYVRTFQKLDLETLVVDYNPQTIEKLSQTQIHAVYGDAEDYELLKELPFHQAQIVVSSLDDFEADQMILKCALAANPEICVIVKTNNLGLADRLYKQGATYVVMPHYIGAHYAARMIKRNGTKVSDYKKDRQDHQHFLSQRL